MFFCFCTFGTKFCEILKFGNNLKLEIIDYIFRKIITLNEVIILKSANEYYRKFFSKKGLKMDLYPAMGGLSPVDQLIRGGVEGRLFFDEATLLPRACV